MALKATYSVVLKANIPIAERLLFEMYCYKITSDEGEELLHFLCTEVDASHHTYIEMQTFRQDDEVLASVRVPHNYVLLIDGSEERPLIGFLS